jgi:glycosyltransferase involved in cell wall biosynthesis
MNIDFRVGGNSRSSAVSGWYSPERHGTWTQGTESRLRLPNPRSAGGYECVLHLTPHVMPGKLPTQELVILAGGAEVFRQEISGGGGYRFVLPQRLLGDGDYCEIVLQCPRATAPSVVGSGSDVRVLGVLVGMLMLKVAGEQAPRGNAPAPPAESLPKVAAVTMVYNEKEYLPLWLRHYGRHVGAENCFVVDHGSEDGSTEQLGGASRVRIPRSPYDPPRQSAFNSQFCASLLKWYDWVIYSDVDEIIMPDPKVAISLRDYCRRPIPDVVSAIGLNIIHRAEHEPPLDLSRPVSEQRRYAFACSPMCKPSLIRRPVVWSPGSHASDAPTTFDHLYMFHLRWFDLPIGLARLKRTREMAWARQEAGAHARIEDEKLIGQFRSFANLSPVDDCDFDPVQPPVGSFLNRVSASRVGREDTVFKISLDIWLDRLWRVPDRFVGTF